MVVPGSSARSRPLEGGGTLLKTIATVGSDEIQLVSGVRSKVNPSLKVPIAVKEMIPPTVVVGLAGLIAIEIRTACVTRTMIFA